MPDVFHWFGSDLQLGPTGDLALVAEPTLTQQRLLRRLLTNPGDYIWQRYGAGLGRKVGEPVNVPRLQALIRAQVALEASVASTPVPVITVASNNIGVVVCTIQYADAASGAAQVLSFQLPA